MNGATSSSDSSLFSQHTCPITTRWLSLYLSDISFNRGMDSMQGGHQVAQKSIRYALPFANSVTGSPCTHLPVVNLGAASPKCNVTTAGGMLESTLAVDGPKPGI